LPILSNLTIFTYDLLMGISHKNDKSSRMSGKLLLKISMKALKPYITAHIPQVSEEIDGIFTKT